ncbi:hypothetical protein [Streptomyces scopuliridis]|uniref:Uncharacterized protein n=1 Tax=Streptomyces scopuliridis RB72 TaxID=1440053 RepID=A0A2T7T6D9_9ACTN|nr:hypothetical protein [Streptomyces scopuliridis]PVE10709.1 hypothetical protein Y717_26330 [Streptomyces scopuliridis RB72]
MALTISLLLGLALFLMLRAHIRFGWGAATVAAGFGFFLASTGAAEPINQLTTALINAIPDL